MTHTATMLPPLLLEAFTTGTVKSAGATRVPLASNVSQEEAVLLYDTVRTLKPENSAEVGFAQGISTLAILKALHDNDAGRHHVADPFQANYGNAGLTMVREAGLDARLCFFDKFAEQVFPELPPLQFVFIDSSHLFDLTVAEFVLADKRLDPGGVIGFHDTWMPSVRKAVRYILANRGYRLRGASTVRSWKSLLSRAIRAMPGASRIFSPEALAPWSTLGIGNLVLMEKVENDRRDWQYHRRF